MQQLNCHLGDRFQLPSNLSIVQGQTRTTNKELLIIDCAIAILVGWIKKGKNGKNDSSI
ncbi:hypothetical protein BJP36_39290 [Moorena producens JHB]|uniref:Uncharacterized protein n=1 Tax=Moorena producens (strain JHB) TaxID=1454205 RepID=A0A9Q9SUX9_MOOP1|nr:hypothetical protein [Moorena producens]WAN70103.1 hypothetical protein BJP36_39290 [Moorena producens JHB]